MENEIQRPETRIERLTAGIRIITKYERDPGMSTHSDTLVVYQRNLQDMTQQDKQLLADWEWEHTGDGWEFCVD